MASPKKLLRYGAIVAIVTVLGATAAIFWKMSRTVNGAAELATELKDAGRVVLVGGPDLARLAGGETEVVRASDLPAVSAALERSDAAALVAALEASHVSLLLVDGRTSRDGEALSARLSRYEHVEGLRGRYLAPAAALYEIDDVGPLAPEEARALAHVARRLLAGDRPPHVASFPEPLRRVRSVEVMVLLREGSEARLWRSARGSSLARALITAAIVARQRWDERRQAMGRSLEDALPSLDVEVVRLAEDGTLGTRSAAFVERAITDVHGVAFEQDGSWHYLLPEKTRERGGGLRAFEALLEEKSYEPGAFEQPSLRPYRLVATLLGSSEGDSGSALPLPAPSEDDAEDDAASGTTGGELATGAREGGAAAP